jgi:hypothetical protein
MTKLLGKNRLRRENNFIPFFAALTFSFILLISSCSKPAGLIGVVVQPDEAKLRVGYNDTILINAYSQPEDSIRTDELSVNLLGSNMDPVFGNTTASVYMQFMLENADHSFGPNPKLDSLVLHLLYKDSYGDTNTQQTLRAYELEQSIYKDSVYYSNVNLDVGTTDFADFSFIPRPTDSVILGSDTLPPMLRVNLTANPDLGEYLLAAPEDVMASNESFQEYFKGLFVTADPVMEGGSLLSFDILSNYSEMILYYSNDDKDSLQFDYMCTLLNATISKFSHNFETGDMSFKMQVKDGDTALGAQNFYLQGASGVATIFKFPNIKSWSGLGPVAINEAKLILNGSENNPLWGAPQQLSMAQIEDDGSFGYLVDQSEETALYFGGEYNSDANNYTFRITRYIQSLIDDPNKKDNGLYLISTGASIFPNRFVFDGYNPTIDTARRLKLEVLYTKLN